MRFFPALLLSLLFACTPKVDMQAERVALLHSNDLQRKAHLEGDAALLCSQIADSMISVQDGRISKASNADIQQRFEAYFRTVVYRKWDDLEPPIIHVSDDGKLAAVIVRKETEARPADGADSTFSSTFFAWTALYRKVDGEWKIYSNTSTRIRE